MLELLRVSALCAQLQEIGFRDRYRGQHGPERVDISDISVAVGAEYRGQPPQQILAEQQTPLNRDVLGIGLCAARIHRLRFDGQNGR